MSKISYCHPRNFAVIGLKRLELRGWLQRGAGEIYASIKQDLGIKEGQLRQRGIDWLKFMKLISESGS